MHLTCAAVCSSWTSDPLVWQGPIKELRNCGTKRLQGQSELAALLKRLLSAVVDEIAHSMEAFPAFGLLLLPEDLLVGRCSEKAIPTLTIALVQPSKIEKGTFEK